MDNNNQNQLVTSANNFLNQIVKHLVSQPNDVVIKNSKDANGNHLINLTVHKDDMPGIIGKSGRTANSLRTLLNLLTGRHIKKNSQNNDSTATPKIILKIDEVNANNDQPQNPASTEPQPTITTNTEQPITEPPAAPQTETTSNNPTESTKDQKAHDAFNNIT